MQFTKCHSSQLLYKAWWFMPGVVHVACGGDGVGVGIGALLLLLLLLLWLLVLVWSRRCKHSRW